MLIALLVIPEQTRPGEIDYRRMSGMNECSVTSLVVDVDVEDAYDALGRMVPRLTVVRDSAEVRLV
jgi:hypothetical protein